MAPGSTMLQLPEGLNPTAPTSVFSVLFSLRKRQFGHVSFILISNLKHLCHWELNPQERVLGKSGQARLDGPGCHSTRVGCWECLTPALTPALTPLPPHTGESKRNHRCRTRQRRPVQRLPNGGQLGAMQ